MSNKSKLLHFFLTFLSQQRHKKFLKHYLQIMLHISGVTGHHGDVAVTQRFFFFFFFLTFHERVVIELTG